ncbi:elongation factor P [Buchnera aphidicola]|uniref:Elongation factor P n=1 Tax=Buchnera aphidicola subsp. Melaphis rhois TaxID=118103 RepID=A0A4D6Y065_BUCMH|nr:elongation factor P [Buchnera aphidicola]QCI23072.1 elongation factor P [Buchnera aphidicola (Melaphis rhois)]
MTFYYSNQLKIGLKVIYHSEPYIIISSKFTKPGKGQEFFRVKLKNLVNKKILDKTCKPNDSFLLADIKEVICSYVFNDGYYWIFMNKKNFEQISVKKSIIKGMSNWLLEEYDYIITFWNDEPISIIIASNFIEIKVIETTPVIKASSISVANKLAKLSTGITLKVPMFIQVGQMIKVDTRSGKYIAKVR